jgi:hypothetical protein
VLAAIEKVTPPRPSVTVTDVPTTHLRDGTGLAADGGETLGGYASASVPESWWTPACPAGTGALELREQWTSKTPATDSTLRVRATEALPRGQRRSSRATVTRSTLTPEDGMSDSSKLSGLPGCIVPA